MLPYTAGDGLQIIAREYGIVANLTKESEVNSLQGLSSIWHRMLQPFWHLKAI